MVTNKRFYKLQKHTKDMKKLRNLLPIIVGALIPIIVATTDLGNKIFNTSEAQEKRAVKTLDVSKNDLYKTPLGNYFTSRDNLNEFLMLAGYDAGTIGREKNGYFDPNSQKEEFLLTCQRTDKDENRILSKEEIKERLKTDYNWNPINF